MGGRSGVLAALRLLVAAGCLLSWGGAQAEERATARSALADLQRRHNATVYEGLLRLRARKAPGEEHLVGDNTDRAGMRWTKCTNLGLDLIATLVAEEKKLTTHEAARQHVDAVVTALAALPTYHGLFPEVLTLDATLRPEARDGGVRYSSIDSAWVTFALSLVETRYRGVDDALAARARALVDRQDYSVLVGKDGLLGAGALVDPTSGKEVSRFAFSYGDRNSEARPLVLALVGLGKLPASAWDGMRYEWAREEGVTVARGWHGSAFVELTGQIFFDEASLAPRSLGRSHAAYLEATKRVARRHGHVVFGYAPACHLTKGYAEYGLASPDVVSPYAAATLATTFDASAIANLATILAKHGASGRPLPDGLSPRTGAVYCEVARTLDQSLLFLALNVDAVWPLVRRAPFYASAEVRLRELDRTAAPPAITTGTAPPKHSAASQEERRPSTPAKARAVLSALQRAVREAEAGAGGAVAVAARRSDLASATAVRAWAELLPDLAFFARREMILGGATARTSESPYPERTYLELQGRATVSLEVVRGGVVAGAAKDEARAEARLAERDAAVVALEAYAAMVLAERRVAVREAHEASLRALVDGLDEGLRPGAADDVAAVRAELASVQHGLAAAEGAKARITAKIRALAGYHFTASGLEPDAAPERVLAVFDEGPSEPWTGEDDVALAHVEVEKSLLGVAQSRVWYAPELRGRLVATRVEQASSTPAEQLLGELTLAFLVRPDAPLREKAQEAAVLRGLWRYRDALAAREEVYAGAKASLANGEALAAAKAGLDVTVSELDDVIGRFVRGERDAASLVGASKAFLEAHDRADAELADALAAKILAIVYGRPRSTSAALSTAASGAAPPITSSAALDAATRAALPKLPIVQATAADAARADAELAAHRWSFRATVEGGVVDPLSSSTVDAPVFGGLGGNSGGGLLWTRVREPAFLARLSMVETGNAREEQAARAEAALRAAEKELARKSAFVDQGRARLRYAYAEARVRAASELATLADEALANARRLHREGLLEDDASLREAEARASAARVRHARAEAAAGQTRITLNRLLDRDPDAPILVAEDPTSLEAHLRDIEYPSAGLVGRAAEQRLRVLELEARRAEARLAAWREPPRTMSLALQGTHAFSLPSYSLGLALGVSLDPVVQAPRVLEAAEHAGRARGDLAAARARVEEERRLVRSALERALRLRDDEARHRDELGVLRARLEDEQRAQVYVHASAKYRTRVALELAARDADLRLLEARERLAETQLRALDLGLAPSAVTALRSPIAASDGAEVQGGAVAPAARLEDAVARWVATDPSLRPTDEAAKAVLDESLRPAVLGGLHVAGPAVGASYGRSAVAMTSHEARGTVGLGATYSLEEGLSFAATLPAERAAAMAKRAARRRAELAAVAHVVALVAARDAVELASRRESEARARLEAIAWPRYQLGHIGAPALAEAAAAHAAAKADVDRARGAYRDKRAILVSRGADVTDAVLDEVSSLAANADGRALARALDVLRERELRADPTIEQARARRDAAWGETFLAALRTVGPVTGFVDLQALGRGTEGAGSGPGSREALWAPSVVVPFQPKALADVGVEAFRLRVREAELARKARLAEVALADNRAELAVALPVWRAAEERRRASGRAVDEMRRRYREGAPGASIDALAKAQDDLFDAERTELEAKEAFLAVAAEIETRLRSPDA